MNGIKAVKTAALGVIPLIWGILLDKLMMLPIPAIIWTVLGIASLILWGLLAKKTMQADRRPVVHMLLLNAVGLVMLILVLIQELVFGRYLGNFAGLAGQFYFLPCLGPASWLVQTIARPVVLHSWYIYLLEYALMAAASLWGSEKGNSK